MQRALNRVLKDNAPDGHLSFCTHTPSVFAFLARVLRGGGDGSGCDVV